MFEFFVKIIITWTNLKPKLFSPFEVSSSSCVFLSYSLPRLWELYLIQPFFLHPSDLWSMKNYAVSISISYKSLFVFTSIFVFCDIPFICTLRCFLCSCSIVFSRRTIMHDLVLFTVFAALCTSLTYLKTDLNSESVYYRVVLWTLM